MGLHPALDDVGGGVGGAVVDDEDLGIPVALGNAGEDAIEGVLDARTLVVRGNDDAKARRAHVRLVCRHQEKRNGNGEFMIRHFYSEKSDIRDERSRVTEAAADDARVRALLHSAA